MKKPKKTGKYYLEARGVPCPICRARVGERCNTTDRQGTFMLAHLQRIQLQQRRGRV